jgi:hypothetical protein
MVDTVVLWKCSVNEAGAIKTRRMVSVSLD